MLYSLMSSVSQHDMHLSSGLKRWFNSKTNKWSNYTLFDISSVWLLWVYGLFECGDNSNSSGPIYDPKVWAFKIWSDNNIGFHKIEPLIPKS